MIHKTISCFAGQGTRPNCYGTAEPAWHIIASKESTLSTSRLFSEVDYTRNGKQFGFLRLPYSTHESAYGFIPIPVVCIKNGSGPRVLLIAGNHGDEYEGQVALTKLARSLEFSRVSGRIIMLTAANLPAALAGRRTSPLDPGEAGNLNRSFPGAPRG